MLPLAYPSQVVSNHQMLEHLLLDANGRLR
jgi:hypothetical protein